MSEIYAQVDRLLDVRRYREAEQLLGDALRESPDDPELLVYAARLDMEREDLESARASVEKCLSLDPKHFTGRLVLYDLERACGRDADAERVIIDVLRDFPRNGALLAVYAKLMLDNFNLRKARTLVDEALRLEPEDETAQLVDVILSTIEGNQSRADAQLSDVLVRSPDAYETTAALVYSLSEKGQHKSALELTKQLLRAEPNDPDLIEAAVELRVASHPLGLPLRPFARFGWGASAALWGGFIVIYTLLRQSDNPWLLIFLAAYLSFVVYSWIYPPLMKRWVRSRGIG